jgi:hypothetical protein
MAGKRGMKRTRSYGLRARAWWILRKNKTTTLADLLMSLNDGSHKHADRNLGQYLTLLTKVGVLQRERVSDGKLTSNGVYLYRLKTDLGHKNPIVRKDGIYDPNSQQLLSFVETRLIAAVQGDDHELD